MVLVKRYTVQEIKDGSGFEPDALFERVEDYNGWSNRETWAVVLHINNDQGWQEQVLEALRSWIDDLPAPDDEIHGATAWGAGDIVKDNVEEALDGMAELFQGEAVGYYSHLLGAARDIGSLWRVDWAEVGASFLDSLRDV